MPRLAATHTLALALTSTLNLTRTLALISTPTPRQTNILTGAPKREFCIVEIAIKRNWIIYFVKQICTMLLCTAAGLMALRLQEMDVPARSWQGWQVPLRTNSAHSAARIEEEMVVTPDGPQVISLYPAEELPISVKY